jgi:hypothetical protein
MMCEQTPEEARIDWVEVVKLRLLYEPGVTERVVEEHMIENHSCECVRRARARLKVLAGPKTLP